MDCLSNNAVTGFNDIAEEGEITEDVVRGDLDYDLVSSNSLSASKSSNCSMKDKFSFGSDNFSSVVGTKKSDRRKLDKNRSSKSMLKRKRRSRTNSNPMDKNDRLDYSESSHKNSVLHRSSLISELNTSKSADVIFVREEDRTHGLYTRRGSTQEKENSGGYHSSKSSEKDKDCSKKKLKRRHSSRTRVEYHHNDSSARKKYRQENLCKHKNEKAHKHHSHYESETHSMDSSRHLPHSYSRTVRSSDPNTCRSYRKDPEQKKELLKKAQKETHVISSEGLNRFKDNILMRKLLESGTVRTRRDSGGSDLNCEIGSISTVSSPDYDMFEDLLINDVNSIDNTPKSDFNDENKGYLENISEDSEVEVIIPEKKIPELIDLHSDSDGGTVEFNKVDFNKDLLEPLDPQDKCILELSEASRVQNNIDECVNSNPQLTTAAESVETQIEEENKCEEEECASVNVQSGSEKVINESVKGNNCISTEDKCAQEEKEKSKNAINETEDEDDLQLRLAALKSAVMKKHLHRQQRQAVLKSATPLKDKQEVNSGFTDYSKSKCPKQNDNTNQDMVSSPKENAYCPSNRTSPYSPTSSYTLSLDGENDKNVGEQDMEIAATDEEDPLIEEQNIQVSSCAENFYKNHYDNKVVDKNQEFCNSTKSPYMSPKILVDFHSAETTADSIGIDNGIDEIPPQPLPPGVDRSGLPPEFHHSLFVSHETKCKMNPSSLGYETDFTKTSNHQFMETAKLNPENPSSLSSLRNGLISTETIKIDHHYDHPDPLSVRSDSQNLVFQNQSPSGIENEVNFSSCRPECNEKENTTYFELHSSKTAGNSCKCKEPDILSKDTLKASHFQNSIESKREDSNEVLSGENRIYESGDGHQEFLNCETLSRSSFFGEYNKHEKVRSVNEESVESRERILFCQNDSKSATFSEKSQDSFQKDEDESVLRANLLTSLRNVRVDSPKRVEKPVKVKSVRMNQKRFSRKRIVLKPCKRNVINGSGRDNGPLPLRYGRNDLKESLQITYPVNESDNKSNLTKSRQVISKNTSEPNKPVSKFIIRVGQDSDSAEEDGNLIDKRNVNSNNDGDDWFRKVSIRDVHNKPSSFIKATAENCVPELEKSVDLLLKQVRLQHELKNKNHLVLPINKNNRGVVFSKTLYESSYGNSKETVESEDKQDNLTPLAVRHLPKSQQEEYRRLKQQILARERLRQLKVLNVNQQSLNPVPLTTKISKTVELKQVPVCVNNNENQNSGTKSPVILNSDNLCANCHQKNSSTTQTINNETCEMLAELETKFINERYCLLDRILDLDLVMRKYDQQSQSYDTASKEVVALQEKLTQAELRLENCTKEFDTVKKEVYIRDKKLDESRLKYEQSRKTCDELGHRSIGPDYKLPKVAEELMMKRLEEVLKIRKNCPSSVVNKDVANINQSMDLDKEHINVNQDLTETDKEEIVDKKRLINDFPTHEDAQEVKKSKPIEHKNTGVSHIPVESTSCLPTSDCLSENYLTPYVSPLTHLHGGPSRRLESGGRSNPDAVLCPYDLRGSCMDEACPYQH